MAHLQLSKQQALGLGEIRAEFFLPASCQYYSKVSGRKLHAV